MVIARGTEKQHIWTFAVVESYCPCNIQPGFSTPPYVGNDYFFESDNSVPNGVFSSGDQLWDGENCGTERPAVSLTLHHTFARTYS